MIVGWSWMVSVRIPTQDFRVGRIPMSYPFLPSGKLYKRAIENYPLYLLKIVIFHIDVRLPDDYQRVPKFAAAHHLLQDTTIQAHPGCGMDVRSEVNPWLCGRCLALKCHGDPVTPTDISIP